MIQERDVPVQQEEVAQATYNRSFQNEALSRRAALNGPTLRPRSRP
jgi:hypothetical protein